MSYLRSRYTVRMLSRLALALFFALITAGCGSSDDAEETNGTIELDPGADENSGEPRGDGNGEPGQGNGSSNGNISANLGTNLSCAELIQCVGNCPSEGQQARKCGRDCGDRATDKALQLFDKWWSCVEKSGCAQYSGDRATQCVRQNCSSETNQCIQHTSQATGDNDNQDGSGTLPDGRMPSELVGKWTDVTTSGTDLYNPNTGSFTGDVGGTATTHRFKADGSWWNASLIRTTYGCVSEVHVYNKGQATVKDGVLYLHSTDGRTITESCGRREVKEGNTYIERYRWKIEPSGDKRVLLLDKINDDYSVRLHYEQP